jgi:PKD repeat protein
LYTLYSESIVESEEAHMSNGIRALSPESTTQVIPGRCKLYLMLAIACFGLLLSEAYVIAQLINGFNVDREIAKIRGGEHSKIPSPDEYSIDDDRIVTYKVRNDTKRELLFLLKGRNEKALLVKPGTSESTDVLPGSYEIAVRGWADDERVVKPQYEILPSEPGKLYTFTYSSVKIYPCSIIAEQDHILQGQAVTFSGIVATRVFNKDELEQAEYRFYFDDGTERVWSKEARAKHVYSKPGTYEAVLEVRSGGKKYISRGVKITVDRPPVDRQPVAVSLRAEPVNPVTGQVVDFTAIPNVNTEGIEYKFDFGDGKVIEWSGKTTAKHAYDREGKYSAYVRARLGRTIADSHPVPITVRIDYKVTIYATSQGTEQGVETVLKQGDEAPLEQYDEIVFGAAVSPEARGASFRFDFGDNSPTDWTEKSEMKHAYSSPGRYTPYVIARIGEEELQSGEIIINVRRRPPIEVYLRASTVKPRIGENVHFSTVQEARTEGTEFRFDFGDGKISGWSTATTENHAYDREGEYIASVKARLGDEVADSNSVKIQVKEDYKVAVYTKAQRARGGDEIIYRQGDETVFRQGDEIVFGAVLTPEAHGALFKFDFGDNSSTDWALKSEVKHKYTSPGEYISHVTARIGEETFQSGEIVINVKDRKLSIFLLLLLLIAAVCYLLSRKIVEFFRHKPSLQFKPGGDPGIQRVDSDTSLQLYPEIRLRSVLEPDKDRVEIEVSLAVGEEVET